MSSVYKEHHRTVSKQEHIDAFNRPKAFAASPLPCLNSNNSIGATSSPAFSERFTQKEEKLNIESAQSKKTAMALEMNVHAFVEKHGLNHVGFLTLTFADNVQCPKEAQRRFNSLRTNFLSQRYKNYIRVYERTKAGRIHYHLLVSADQDIRRGLNFQEIQARNYKSANPFLRNEWKVLRENLSKYGFGRSELLPVKTNSKGLSKYISKYISKHIESRINEDKGFRLVQTSIDKASFWKTANCNFSFVSKGAKLWRLGLSRWVQQFVCYVNTTGRLSHLTKGSQLKLDANNFSDFLRQVSPKWAFLNRSQIIQFASLPF